MPRKPHSVFLIVETPYPDPAVEATHLGVHRLALDDREVEDVVAEWRMAHTLNAGQTIYVVEDTKVQGYEVGLKLMAIDDPRLDEDEEQATHGL